MLSADRAGEELTCAAITRPEGHEPGRAAPRAATASPAVVAVMETRGAIGPGMEQLLALAGRLCRLSVDLLGAEATWTFLEDRAREAFVRVASLGSGDGTRLPSPPAGLRRDALGGLLPRLAREGVVDGPDAVDLSALVGTASELRTICMGLQDGEELVGVQVAVRRRRFAPGTARLARVIADVGSLGLANHALRVQLERAWNASTEYLANASHGLRTPLNVILGYAEMARDPETDRTEQERYIDLIARYAQVLAGAVDALCRASHVLLPLPGAAPAGPTADGGVREAATGAVPELLGAIRASTRGVRRLYGATRATIASAGLVGAIPALAGELTSTAPRPRAGSSR